MLPLSFPRSNERAAQGLGKSGEEVRDVTMRELRPLVREMGTTDW